MICTKAIASQTDFSTFTNLSIGARTLATYLNRQSRKYRDIWVGIKKIADALGVCISTASRWLKELELKGLVDIVKDYALDTRRRIVMLWRQPSQEAASAPVAVHTSPVSVAPVELVPVASEPPPPRPKPATEAEVAKVVAKAEKLFGSPMRRRVVTLAMETRLSWVEQACDLAEETGDVKSWGWVITVCRNWLLDPPPVKKSYQQEQAELLAFLVNRYGVGS